MVYVAGRDQRGQERLAILIFLLAEGKETRLGLHKVKIGKEMAPGLVLLCRKGREFPPQPASLQAVDSSYTS